MPVFVDDPVLLSKERLKSELVAHSVPLPPGEKKKQVYLELYLKHVAHKKPADFSSDEEEEDGAPEGELETVIEEEDEDKNTEVMDVYQLTDEQLKGELIKHGVKPGPIVASTRALYEKKLQRLVDPSRKPAPELAQNSTHDASQYSDSEEDETGSEYEPQRAVTGTGRAHHGHSQLSQHRGEYRPRKEDVLEEMFPDEVRTPTGISATRRRPIKGAAGRPVQFKYSEMVPHSRPLQQEKQEELRCLVPIWIQVLVFFALAGFFLFVYYTMNSLSEYTEISGQGSEVTQEQLPAAPQEAAMAQDTPLHTVGQE
ncbi:LEM domain-containing protein 1 isoform X4 [Lepisosteus oculatus]|uniref:LEM domain-containing protein 1 isoform X4 n=1 Tax=Lepisosteus oculatus TaxID=7918 RepID=UPI00371F4C83